VRACFLLKVRADRIEEHRRRHAEVWPDMLAALRETGWRHYSPFPRPDGLLVGYFGTDDLDAARAGMAAREVNTR
jgi:L-rhamnose mutarotase